MRDLLFQSLDDPIPQSPNPRAVILRMGGLPDVFSSPGNPDEGSGCCFKLPVPLRVLLARRWPQASCRNRIRLQIFEENPAMQNLAARSGRPSRASKLRCLSRDRPHRGATAACPHPSSEAWSGLNSVMLGYFLAT